MGKKTKENRVDVYVTRIQGYQWVNGYKISMFLDLLAFNQNALRLQPEFIALMGQPRFEQDSLNKVASDYRPLNL